MRKVMHPSSQFMFHACITLCLLLAALEQTQANETYFGFPNNKLHPSRDFETSVQFPDHSNGFVRKSNCFHPAKKDASLYRKILDDSLKVTYNIHSFLRAFKDTSKFGKLAGKFGPLLAQLHYASAVSVVIYDITAPPESNHQQLMHGFRQLRNEFHSINLRLDSLLDSIKGVVHTELKNVAFGQIIDRSDAIIDIADKLVTACHEGKNPDHHFKALVRQCRNFESATMLKTIRRYHITESELFILVESAKYDYCTLNRVHLALGLMLEKLLRANDISIAILELAAESEDDWRTQLLKRVSDDDTCTNSNLFHSDMIAEAQFIFKEFPILLLSKLRKGALSRGLPEDTRSVLQNYASTDDALEMLFQVVMNKYRPLFCDDNLEFFVATYRECKQANPRPSEQFFHTNPEKELFGNPCAVKVERVNGKCAIVMWNTCTPAVSAADFASMFSCDYVAHYPSLLDDSLRSSSSKLSREQYSSWHLVRHGNGWRGIPSVKGRFVCQSGMQLYRTFSAQVVHWFKIVFSGDPKGDYFSVVIA